MNGKLYLAASNTAPARCTEHPAFEADYCPSCGTAQVIGGVR